MKQISFHEDVGEAERRKLRARGESESAIWRGIGMFGLIGWSVAVPAVLGAFAGAWLDRNHPAARSWTLTLLVAGLMLGCWNAWRWVAREQQAVQKENDREVSPHA